MAKEIREDENYTLGSGDLKVTAYSGDTHHSDITIKVDNVLKVIGSNSIEKFSLGATAELKNSEIYVYARISKTGLGNNVSFTIKLKDEENTHEYAYQTQEEENIIKYKVYIKLS
jgi:hypothetical protein